MIDKPRSVGIVAEYNPFHNGHLGQINRIRELFGANTEITVLMSGNFVERAEPAVYSKYIRAEAAVKCGVNLVLELPAPYSFGSARDYARAAVGIFNMLGITDTLVFGSECGETFLLKDYAEKSISLEGRTNPKTSFQKSMEKLFRETYGGFYPEKPNDILASEYIRALVLSESGIEPYTLKRESDFSAHAARNAIYGDGNSEGLIPADVLGVFENVKPADREVFGTLALHSAINCAPDTYCCGDGEAGFIRKTASSSESYPDFEKKLSCGRFSRARLRRGVLSSILGVTEADMRQIPLMTVHLASDEIGRTLLKRARKNGCIKITDLPSELENDGGRQAEIMLSADRLYCECIGKSIAGMYKYVPYMGDKKKVF